MQATVVMATLADSDMVSDSYYYFNNLNNNNNNKLYKNVSEWMERYKT